jgi:uracil-DNA glycosylase family 4
MDATLFKTNLLKELYRQYPTPASFGLDAPAATHVVYGEGNPNATLMVVGEAPGEQEDKQARPFVGRSGQLLTRTLAQLGVPRPALFITNVVKCRPPNNRTPTPQEIEIHKKALLLKEIKIIRPKVIIPVGAVAISALLPGDNKISKIRGIPYHAHDTIILATYHPAYILRNPAAYTDFCNDLKKAISLSNS